MEVIRHVFDPASLTRFSWRIGVHRDVDP